MSGEQIQEEIVAFLSRPENLGAAGPVERIDTHGAIIFLAGDRAYKLKRAIRYGYLDFSTPDKRKAACEAEFTLNRRTAPDLYMEVRAINRRADGGVGFGSGEPVDWLVVMRRFPAGDLLEEVAARGDLSSTMVRELADRVAAFHDIAEIVPVKDGAARVRAVIDSNRDSMREVPRDILSADKCAALHQHSLDVLARLASLLDARGSTGQVRHCHGDLHLTNICLWQGRPTLFDCLEFDPELARIDVLYDLAFLLMDLWHKGYRKQASLVFNRYLDRRDESEGVPALPLFLSMRAAVRAHVAATAAGQQQDASKSTAKCGEAKSYRSAALSFLEPSPPRMIAIGGLSGAGKSTLAASLAPEIGGAPGARWLRTDVLRKRLAGVAPEDTLPPQAYTRERNAEIYNRLMAEAAMMLAKGWPVIVDGVFAQPSERVRIAAVAETAGIPFAGLWLEAPREMLHARVSARRGDASDADATVVDRQLGYNLGEITPWRRVDASGSPSVTLMRAQSIIAAGGKL